MSPEMFDLARQRWIANIMYKSTSKKIKEDTEDIGRFAIDSVGLNTRIHEMGGMNGEILKEAFKDAPAKLQILRGLQRMLQQSKDKLALYRSDTESMAEMGQLQSLFSNITFPLHLTLTAQTGKTLASKPSINPFVGGTPGTNPITDNPLTRGIASQAFR